MRAATVQIHFVRFRGTAQERGTPIVYLAGGPPGSGTYSAAGDRFDLFMSLREIGDVLALDQRGTFLVEPSPVCPERWSYPLAEPWRTERLEEILAPYLETCAEHWADSVDLAAFNTRESAGDLEDLRRALGAEKLSLWGISYGTKGHSGFWKHGYDFSMPIGSIVTASRAGTVGWARDGCRDGDRSCTNLVTIIHDDHTVTVYSHLTLDGVLVEAGQLVVAGDTIAHSGNTGNTGGFPHLHFSLHPCHELPGLPDPSDCPSLPLTFRNTDANPEGLVAGRSYPARAK